LNTFNREVVTSLKTNLARNKIGIPPAMNVYTDIVDYFGELVTYSLDVSNNPIEGLKLSFLNRAFERHLKLKYITLGLGGLGFQNLNDFTTYKIFNRYP